MSAALLSWKEVGKYCLQSGNNVKKVGFMYFKSKLKQTVGDLILTFILLKLFLQKDRKRRRKKHTCEKYALQFCKLMGSG